MHQFKPYWPAILLFCIEAGLQVSGITSLPLAILLWGLSGSFAFWAFLHQRAEKQEKISIGVSRIATVVLVVGAFGTIAAASTVAIGSFSPRFFGPHEGDPAENIIHIDNDSLVSPDKSVASYIQPYATTVWFTPEKPIIGCQKGVLLVANEIPADILDKNFRIMVAELSILGGVECRNQNATDQQRYFSAFTMPPTFMSDKDAEQIRNGTTAVFALYVWRYTIEGRPKEVFIREHCIYVSGTTPVHACEGDHDRTYRHIVN